MPIPYWYIDTGFTALLILLAAVDEELGAVFFGPPDIADFRARFGVPDEWTPIARSRSAILTCPPIQFRPPAPASASPSMNWPTAAGNGTSRDLYATSVKPFRSVSPSKAGTARGAPDPAPRSAAV
jgi:hypothetical protein